MIPVNINNSIDISLGFLSHDLFIPPAPVAIAPSVEMVCTQKWAGFFLNNNKLTTTVEHNGKSVVLKGHNCGPLIFDITIPPSNVAYAWIWPFSDRKITFSASTVKMDGTPTGCAQIFMLPLPMMTCGDPLSAPTAFILTSDINNALVGMSMTDFLLGLLDIVLSMAIDALFEWGWKGPKGPDVLDKGKTITDKLIGKFMPTDLKGWAKKGVSSLAGLLTSSLEGNPTFKVGVGNHWKGTEISIDSNGPALQQNFMGVQGNSRGELEAWGTSL